MLYFAKKHLTSQNGLKVAKAGHKSEGCKGMIPDRHDKRIKAEANERKENRKADTKKKRVQDKAKPNLKEPAKKEPRGQIEDKTGYHQLPFKTAAKLYWIPKLTTQEMEN